MGGGFILYSGITPPSTPPKSPRSESSERTRLAPVYLNNQAIDVPKRLQADVCNAADSIRSNWLNALNLKKELVLNPDILIPLLNHAKLYWHDWLDKQPEETSASDRIENAFINNKNLSKEESDCVRKIISDYKNTVEMAVSQSNSNPIPIYFCFLHSIWVVREEPVRVECQCLIM
jgi:hypothetical protein